MCEHEPFCAVFDGLQCAIRARFIGKMAELAANALLQVKRVRTMSEHIHIMIGFQHNGITAADGLLYLV